MRIDPVGTPPGSGPGPAPETTPPPALSPSVMERIQQVTDPGLRAELGPLIAEVDDRARRLMTAQGRGEFGQYKAAVKNFMSKVLPQSYRAEETRGQRKDGKFVVYLMVKKVDEALEDLAQLLMQGQQDSLKLVAGLDEIRGLLLDMML